MEKIKDNAELRAVTNSEEYSPLSNRLVVEIAKLFVDLVKGGYATPECCEDTFGVLLGFLDRSINMKMDGALVWPVLGFRAVVGGEEVLLLPKDFNETTFSHDVLWAAVESGDARLSGDDIASADIKDVLEAARRAFRERRQRYMEEENPS